LLGNRDSLRRETCTARCVIVCSRAPPPSGIRLAQLTPGRRGLVHASGYNLQPLPRASVYTVRACSRLSSGRG
jgi:hypothetical protein